MDVERIQKINKLALDLMRQGLASDRDDAVVQAEKIFRAKDGEYSSIRERMQGGPEPQREASAASLALTPNTQQAVASADLHPEKVKDILQQNSQFLVKKITEFQEQMQAMRKELDAFKQQRMGSPQQAQVSTAPLKLGEIPANNDIQRGPSTQASATNHPRTGNFKAEEISIEKFFYMGNRR